MELTYRGGKDSDIIDSEHVVAWLPRVPLIILGDFLTSVNNYGPPAAILNTSY